MGEGGEKRHHGCSASVLVRARVREEEEGQRLLWVDRPKWAKLEQPKRKTFKMERKKNGLTHSREGQERDGRKIVALFRSGHINSCTVYLIFSISIFDLGGIFIES
jgi:hypothetical protein